MDLSELEKVLLQDDFDVEKHAASLVQQGVDITKYVNNLTDAERSLDGKLEAHVSLHHNDLLCQATSVERLETHLSSVSGQAENLLASVDRLTGRVNDDTMKGNFGSRAQIWSDFQYLFFFPIEHKFSRKLS